MVPQLAPEERTENITARITPTERNLLDEAARLLERSRGDVLRRALRAFASEIVRESKKDGSR
jgi:uncharacterized protein (DUF1778 family)